jgi:hypothetical protein
MTFKNTMLVSLTIINIYRVDPTYGGGFGQAINSLQNGLKRETLLIPSTLPHRMFTSEPDI